MFFLTKMSEELNKEQQEIIDFSISAYKRYRRYEIPKKTTGNRSIHHPSPQLKLFQKYISKEVFLRFPVHKSVFSYRKGVSTKDLANEHKNNRYLLRIDFRNFFPSFRGENIRLFLKNSDLNLNDLEITLINLLVCKKDKLTIGAPSSPAITNAILYDFDKNMFDMCEEKRIKYSRYADDLYFSTNEDNELSFILEYINKYKFQYGIKLQVNNKKNIYTSKKHKRVITGLTITTDNNISVGRKQKRIIKSLINSYKYHNIDIEKKKYLKGYLSYLLSVEPSYIINLKKKYGEDLINDLLFNEKYKSKNTSKAF